MLYFVYNYSLLQLNIVRETPKLYYVDQVVAIIGETHNVTQVNKKDNRLFTNVTDAVILLQSELQQKRAELTTILVEIDTRINEGEVIVNG